MTFERVVFNQINQCFVENNLLFDGQYGFMKHHSMRLAALELVDRISKSLDKKKCFYFPRPIRGVWHAGSQNTFE